MTSPLLKFDNVHTPKSLRKQSLEAEFAFKIALNHKARSFFQTGVAGCGSHGENHMTQTRPAELDLEHLLAMTGGDADLAEEVIGIFRHQVEIWSRLLDPRAPSSQWADAAHTLKGAALSIGAQELAETCSIAEKAGRDEAPPTPAGAALLLNDIKDQIGETLEACSRTVHRLSQSGFNASNASNS